MRSTATLLLAAALAAALVINARAGSLWPPGEGPADEVAIASKGYRYKYGKHPKHGKHYKEHVKYEPKGRDTYAYPDEDGSGEAVADSGADPIPDAELCWAGKDVAVSGPLNQQCPPPPNPNPQACSPIPNTCPVPAPDCSPSTCSPKCPAGHWTRFGTEQVQEHYEDQPRARMADVRHQSYHCVDARGDEPMLGTPGGDLAELMAATAALIRVRGKKHVTKRYLQQVADEVFYEAANNIISAERPLYFHTDDSRLRALFVYLKDILGEQPSIMPFVGPSGGAGQVWVDALQRPELNGCGHVRLMLDPPTTPYYSTALDSATVEDCVVAKAGPSSCIDAKVIAAQMIENYFNFWWFTPPGSPERRQTAFHVEGILGGPLLGAAVTIVTNKPADACPHQAPKVYPNFGASQAFVYHPNAVSDWRAYAARTGLSALVPEGQMNAFIAEWNSIAAFQLGATLTFLPPANAVGLFSVEIPVSAAGGHAHHHHH